MQSDAYKGKKSRPSLVRIMIWCLQDIMVHRTLSKKLQWIKTTNFIQKKIWACHLQNDEHLVFASMCEEHGWSHFRCWTLIDVSNSQWYPLPWASVHWLVQCTLECHWNATGWPSVHWNTTGKTSLKQPYTGMPLEKLSWIRPTLGSHWRNFNFCSLHWNTTGGTVTAHTRPDTYS